MDNTGNISPDDLPLSADTRARLMRWAARYDATLDLKHPDQVGFANQSEAQDFAAEGQLLAESLQRELGPEYTVEYHFDARGAVRN